jgi:myo-inositol-1(or 4)-monophosphatase
MTHADPENELTEIARVAADAARAAGREIAARLGAERDIRSKGLRDLVTDADLAAQDVLVGLIRARFPAHAILSEESSAPRETADITWVLDPVDGTSNYAHRFPCFSVSVGVCDAAGPLVGVVYDPLRDHLFAAERGRGARLNEKTLHVSVIAEPMDAIIGLDFAREPQVRAALMERMALYAPHVHTFRSIGSAALGLCYVAAGWQEVYFHAALAPWDSAAGALLVREAGGLVTALDGTQWSFGTPSCLASNGQLHATLLALAG